VSDEIREKFENDLAVVEWRDLRTHTQRDSVILVDPQLDLVDVAVAVAGDAAEQVAAWIEEGRLGKPDEERLQFLEGALDTPFRVLIARPFLLVQELEVG
jgi:hypothetical protein